MKAVLFLAAILSLTACSTTNQKTNENTDLYMGGFDGVWVGNFKGIKGKGYPFIATGEEEFAIMLMIKDDYVSVTTTPKGKKPNTVKEGKFKIIKHKTNAIIYAQDSESEKFNEEDNGEWVETWNMTLTHKEKNSIYVYYVRSVNNFLLAHDTNTEDVSGRFFYSAYTELTKVATIEKN